MPIFSSRKNIEIIQMQEEFDIDVGAPMPIVLSNEFDVYLTFYKHIPIPGWDGSTINVRTAEDSGVVTVKFEKYRQFKFGSPNDEAIGGHPYASFGLRPYAIQEVLNSDWVEFLRKQNSIHPSHDDKWFESSRHFIFFFHDTCFEIVCDKYTIDNNSKPKIEQELERICKLL